MILILSSIIILSSMSGCIHKRETIIVDGEERSYIIHVPQSYDGEMEVPLVVVLHGGGGNAKNIEEVTDFTLKSEQEGFLVVYPEGTGILKRKLHTWNVGFCCGYALENNIDDVQFIESLITHLKQQYSINRSRVYATGMSNGGIMAYRLGAELSYIFAAIAPVVAQIGGQATEEEEIWRIPEPEHPVSVMAFNGMQDTRVPYYGGPPINNSSHVYWWMGVNDSIGFWVEQNQCTSFPKRNVSENGNIIIDTYTGGNARTEVVLVSIVDGTHSWPGGEKGWDKGDEPTTEISATDMMWDFFVTHPKQE